MPIRPENKHLYPKNWKEIRGEILEREKHHCKFCGVPNHEWISRIFDNDVRWQFAPELEGTWIVLTIAHIDQDPTNNDPMNLAALCQKCHNRLDAPYRAANRKRRKLLESMVIPGLTLKEGE